MMGAELALSQPGTCSCETSILQVKTGTPYARPCFYLPSSCSLPVDPTVGSHFHDEWKLKMPCTHPVQPPLKLRFG